MVLDFSREDASIHSIFRYWVSARRNLFSIVLQKLRESAQLKILTSAPNSFEMRILPYQAGKGRDNSFAPQGIIHRKHAHHLSGECAAYCHLRQNNGSGLR